MNFARHHHSVCVCAFPYIVPSPLAARNRRSCYRREITTPCERQGCTMCAGTERKFSDYPSLKTPLRRQFSRDFKNYERSTAGSEIYIYIYIFHVV